MAAGYKNIKATDDEFVATWNRLGSPKLVGEALGLCSRAIYDRRASLAKRGIFLPTVPLNEGRGGTKSGSWSAPLQFERRRKFTVENGTVVIFSDPHWVPDHDTAGQEALDAVIREVKPQLVICGGDAVDGDTISRWDPTRGHHKRFSVREELECVKEHLDSIRKVAKKAQLAYTLGNHCVRLSRFIAMKAPELLEMPFTRLEDWFPAWPLSWTVEINPEGPGMTVIRHRNQAGMLHLQATKAGCHYVHGHLHKINVHTMPTFAGYRYSVDAGSLADPNSESFDYAEGAPNHCQGFAVLTYRDGVLMPPELCQIINGQGWFRGAAV